jgi:hypothetical protein
MKRKNWRSFTEARKFVQSLKLKKSGDWNDFSKSGKRPKDIPGHPNHIYKKNWISWADFLGSDPKFSKNRKFRSFAEARNFVQSLKLKNWSEYLSFLKSDKRPSDIPSNPNHIYKKDWTTWGDFLGTGTIASYNIQWRSFTKARKFIHSLKLRDSYAWKEYCESGKLPDDIPKNPRGVYKNKGWKNFGDWVGTGSLHPKDRNYLSYTDAKKIIQKYNLSSSVKWKELKKSGNYPKRLPLDPVSVYAGKGWNGWADFLGNDQVQAGSIKYRSFTQARKFAQSLNLKSTKYWEQYCKSGKKPKNIPNYPRGVYAGKGWDGWGDFLGTGTISFVDRAQNYLSWEEAKIEYRRLAKQHGLKNRKDWVIFTRTHKIPKNLPKQPWRTYTKERVWGKMKNE